MAKASALTLMSMVLDSLNQELTRAGAREDLCEMMLLHGDMVVIDYADCGGMGYVRLVSANPTDRFPNPAEQATCATDMAYVMEVGVVRGAPGMKDGDPLPDGDDQLAATDKALRDMDLMKAALRTVESEVENFALGVYAPLGPSGGALGGSWGFTVGDELEV